MLGMDFNVYKGMEVKSLVVHNFLLNIMVKSSLVLLSRWKISYIVGYWKALCFVAGIQCADHIPVAKNISPH